MKQRDPKLWAALSYVFGLVSGVIVLIVEKHDGYVRFHATQSVLTFSAVALLWMLFPTIPIVGDVAPFRGVLWIAVLCLWILLMWKALMGEAYRLPYLGDVANSLSRK